MKSFWKAVCVICFTLIVQTSCLAQTSGGSLAGTVTDSSGAAIQGATVTVTKPSTGVSISATTTGSGYYRFSNLSPGTYTVRVTNSGFATTERTGVPVDTNSTASLDVSLKPGETSQIVDVSANAPQVQTESSDIGTVVVSNEVEGLPLSVGNGAMRNAGDFVFLTPGTYGIGLSGGNFSTAIGGGQSFASEVLLDGASAQSMDYSDGLTQELLPSIDAIQEFKVLVAGIPAEYGRTGGGVQSYTTKTGTNSFHGQAYEIFRNTDLDANDWFNNGYAALYGASGFQRPADKKNEFGGTFGGPVIIPHIYDGHKKTFFFFSWEQFRQIVGVSTIETIPSAANRMGNFASTLGGPLPGNPINPCTGQPFLSGQIFDPSTTTTIGGVQCRLPFAGNMIPTTRFSTVAKNLLAIYPNPTTPTQINNYDFSTSYQNKNTAETIRVDHAFSRGDSVFASYTARDNVRPHVGSPNLPEPLNIGAPGGNSSTQDFFTHAARAGYDKVITPSLLNHLLLGFIRVNNTSAMPATKAGVDWDSQLGIQNGFGTAFPYFSFGEGIQSAGGGPGSAVIGNYSTADDSVIFTKGRHSVVAGVDYRHGQYSTAPLQSASGVFDFARHETAGSALQTTATGNGFASFLLGLPSTIQNSLPLAQPRRVSEYGAIFAQDSFKISSTFLALFGLRYNVDVPLRENSNNDANFSPSTANPGAGGIPGALIFAGTGAGRSGLSSRWASTYFGAFEPRIGFAWSPQLFAGKTAFRGNYQILHTPIQLGGSLFAVPSGFTSTVSLSDSASGGFVAPQSIDSPLPVLSKQINFSPSQLNGAGTYYTAQSFGETGNVQSWSFEIQQQLLPDLILTTTYLGERATHLRSDVEKLNDLHPQYYTQGAALLNPASGSQLPYSGFAGTLAQALRPFPQYLLIDTADTLENRGQSSYDALAVKLERHFRNNLTLLVSYTWSKQLTDSDTNNPGYGITYTGSGGEIQNSFNLQGEKSVSAQDVPNLFVASYVYQLPFGTDQVFHTRSNALNRAIGGWQIGGINRYQTGQPIAFGCATSIPAVDTCIRYNHVAGQSIFSNAWKSGHFNPFTQSAFNPAAFSDPNGNVAATGAYGFGNLPRLQSNVRVPNYLDEDFSIIKRTTLAKTAQLEFRAELFNAFNRHAFSFPDATPSDSGFGFFSYDASTPRQVQFTLRVLF